MTKIKSFGIKGIPMDLLGFYIPKYDTVYYNNELDRYPILKQEVIRHEIQHARYFKGKMTCYKILQNLEFELRDSVKWRFNKLAYKEYTIFHNKNEIKLQEIHKARKLKHYLMMKLIYSPIYMLWILSINFLLIPYYLYIEYRYKV